jgi:hypothetical protein
MSTYQVGTDLTPFTISSTTRFVFEVKDNGLWWDLTGGSALAILIDPTGAKTTIVCAIVRGVPSANWTVVGPVGDWQIQLKATDAANRTQTSVAQVFGTVSSPI